MMRPYVLRLALALLLLGVSSGAGGPMKSSLKFDRTNARALQTRFGTYGFRHQQYVVREAEGFRFWLPGGVDGVVQTGVYSLFALAGDCEVVLSYEILDLPAPDSGYGSGVGLAFDAGDDVGRGIIQRVHRTKEGTGHTVQSFLPGAKGKLEEKQRFVPTTATRGRIGLRRLGKELIFLGSEDPAKPPEEIERHPFTEQTIRAFRVFADPGGGKTAVDVRVREIAVKAEELAGGIPKKDKRESRWWLWGLGVAGSGGALGWWWRRRSREDG